MRPSPPLRTASTACQFGCQAQRSTLAHQRCRLVRAASVAALRGDSSRRAIRYSTKGRCGNTGSRPEGSRSAFGVSDRIPFHSHPGAADSVPLGAFGEANTLPWSNGAFKARGPPFTPSPPPCRRARSGSTPRGFQCPCSEARRPRSGGTLSELRARYCHPSKSTCDSRSVCHASSTAGLKVTTSTRLAPSFLAS